MWWHALPAFSHPFIESILVDGELYTIDSQGVNLQPSQSLMFVLRGTSRHNYIYHLYRDTATTVGHTLVGPNVIMYDDLPKGEYTFEVYPEATPVVGISPLSVHVQSSFLQNWWFLPMLMLYLLLLFGVAGYFVLLSRVRSKEKLADLRTDWTNKLHTDIGADLNSVKVRLDGLKRKLEPLEPGVLRRFTKMQEVLDDVQGKLRFFFDLIDTKKNSLHVMLADVEAYAKQNCPLNGMTFECQNKLDREQDYKIDIGRVNKIYLTMKEAMYNCLKYSKAEKAIIRVEAVKEGLQIEVIDNGKGFDPDRPHTGNGLNNLREYAQEGFMDLQIDSTVGKGTTVRMLIPDL